MGSVGKDGFQGQRIGVGGEWLRQMGWVFGGKQEWGQAKEMGMGKYERVQGKRNELRQKDWGKRNGVQEWGKGNINGLGNRMDWGVGNKEREGLVGGGWQGMTQKEGKAGLLRDQFTICEF